MPTESLYRLVVEGATAELLAFREDRSLWAHEPWSAMFEARLEGSEGPTLIYRYGDDYKRPAPAVKAMAAAHPRLRLTLEWCDEFGTVGGRARYVEGRKLDSERVDPLGLEWVKWEEAEDE
jgi:pimeloyl-ACP methyl ester carboxylesterase